MWSRVDILLLCMFFVCGCQEWALSAIPAKRQPLATDRTPGIPYVNAFPHDGEQLSFRPSSGKGAAWNMAHGLAREAVLGGMCTLPVARAGATEYLFSLVPETQSGTTRWWLTSQHLTSQKITGNDNDTMWHLVPEHYMQPSLMLQPGEFLAGK
jgi:hypothetical protein